MTNFITNQNSVTIPTLEEAINIFNQRWPNVKSSCPSKPIFIFSAGWRSGSTFLQRLLMSSNDVIIWGEPYGHSALIDHLSKPLKAITIEYPENRWFIDQMINDQMSISNFADKWIANLYPEINYLIQSHIAFFINLFEIPANHRGIKRWGLKEVRLSIDHAFYLNWLFPNAKFIFLYRNPYDAYASYRGFNWYNKWPDQPIFNAQNFGFHWKNLLEGYLENHQRLNGLVIKYEDLSDENFDLSKLETFLDIKLDQDIKNKIIYSTKKEISILDFQILRDTVNPLASKLGYYSQTIFNSC